MTADAARLSRRSRYGAGLRSERIAALWLRAKGYRILAHRWRCTAGEIDSVAARGRTVVFVEVKRRGSVQDEDVNGAVGLIQRQRVRRAADIWLARHPRYRDHDVRFDLVIIAPWRWPRHIPNGL